MMWLKLAGLGAAALLIGLAYWHYDHLRDEAAKVPGLQATIQSAENTATDAYALLMEERGRREAAERRYADQQRLRTDIIAAIRASTNNAPVATNPVCFPSPLDRELRNTGLARLLTAGGNPGTPLVPTGPGVDDRSNSPTDIR